MDSYDIVIVGASFSGLSFAHHIPKNFKVLIIDRKPRLDTAIESTGLVTEATRELLADFCDIDRFIPNRITTIGVVSPDYNRYFFSHTESPWIYSTDTPQLVKHLSETLPSNITLHLSANFINYKTNQTDEYPVTITYTENGENKEARTRFLVGADGSRSMVAKSNKNLSQNKKFLIGYEKVFYGEIDFDEHSNSTIYHFWFGEFSLGYGGWLSPTTVNGRSAFRLGLAKLEKDAGDLKRLEDFIAILKDKKIIKVANGEEKPLLTFAHLIPIGGILRRVSDQSTLLIGDAAGFCGAFAADGIKGSVVSGKIGANLVAKFLQGENGALQNYHKEIQKYNGLITYYRKQILYRFLWDRMKTNRTFTLLYRLIERQKDTFLLQFCDSKDRHKSLLSVVLRIDNAFLLVQYTLSIILDFFSFKKRD